MQKRKNILLIVGFLLMTLGFLSLVLQLVGLKLDILSFLYIPGRGFAFLFQLLMVLSGISLMYIAKIGLDQSE
jgi:hypothetical protein